MSSEVLDLAKTAPTSATPILDSAVFPPLVRRKRFLGVAAGLVVGLGIGIWMGSDYTEVDQVWQVIIGITAVLSAVVIVHELGHLLAGWFVGFHFSSFAVGPFSLALQYGKLRLRLRRMAPLGLVAMHAEGVRRLRRRSLIFIAGGPAVNFVSLPATALLVNHVFPAWGRSWMAIPAGHFAALSLLLGFVSITPFGSGSDGQRISILLSSFPSARRLMCIYALGGQSRNGIAPKFWKTTWIRAASRLRDGSRDEFSGNLLAYMAASDCKDADAAASYLERCLELVRGARPVASDIVIVEAAIFTGSESKSRSGVHVRSLTRRWSGGRRALNGSTNCLPTPATP